MCPRASGPTCRKRSGAASGEARLPGPYLFFLGGEKPHKNVQNVVRAFAQARRRQSLKEVLVLAGPLPQNTARLDALISALDLSGSVLRPGIVDEEDLPGLYAGATAFLYPTLYEGFGLPVIEAMACGTPVLTSSTSALQEIAGGYAYLVDPMDVDAISTGIALLSTDEVVRSDFIALGKKRALDFLLGEGRREDVGGLRRLAGRKPEAASGRDVTIMRTAVVHDWLNGMRGARRSSRRCCRSCPTRPSSRSSMFRDPFPRRSRSTRSEPPT